MVFPYIEIALLAYTIDYFFGEFQFIRFYKHPVIGMGTYILWFEKYFYRDSILRGSILTLSLISLIIAIIYGIQLVTTNILILSLLASTGIASHMLYHSVYNVIDHPKSIRYLVSRDTENLTSNECYKAAIETYAENLSDGVIAPLFYLICFGLYGLFVYKGINTLDSMVGYRTKRYEKFGKFSAISDDILNFIPARLTAIGIAIFMYSLKGLRFSSQGKHYESPNAGHPIAAMGLSLKVQLGGSTSYFGSLKSKPILGEGENIITQNHLKQALSVQKKFDFFILFTLGVGCCYNLLS